jgi:hypothetical protein
MVPGTFRWVILLSPECLNSLRSPLLASPSSLFPIYERLFTMLGRLVLSSERLSIYMALGSICDSSVDSIDWSCIPRSLQS